MLTGSIFDEKFIKNQPYQLLISVSQLLIGVIDKTFYLFTNKILPYRSINMAFDSNTAEEDISWVEEEEEVNE